VTPAATSVQAVSPTVSPTVSASAPQLSIDDAAAVAESCTRLMRSFGKIRARVLAMARHDVDWSANLLITKVALNGPIRSSALAELVKSDPSTVSRQVATLVKDGYVERHADPEDGRASLLQITPRGAEVCEEHKRLRNEHYQRMLANWSAAECRSLATMMSRFADDMETARPRWFGDDDLTGGAQPRDAANDEA
jgi:DNA-binding MarR family transcriptional regulator